MTKEIDAQKISSKILNLLMKEGDLTFDQSNPIAQRAFETIMEK